MVYPCQSFPTLHLIFEKQPALSTERLTKVTLMSGCLLKRASSKSLDDGCAATGWALLLMFVDKKELMLQTHED